MSTKCFTLDESLSYTFVGKVIYCDILKFNDTNTDTDTQAVNNMNKCWFLCVVSQNLELDHDTKSCV